MTLSVIDTVTTAGVVMFSPANTSVKLSTYDDKGLYFRTAPADILQGSVLADAMVGAGATKVFILALNDDYGTGLAKDLQKGLESGGAKVLGTKIYDPKAADYSAEVQAAKDSGANAIALIGFDESSKILAKMAEQGIPLNTVWGVDGNMGNVPAVVARYIGKRPVYVVRLDQDLSEIERRWKLEPVPGIPRGEPVYLAPSDLSDGISTRRHHGYAGRHGFDDVGRTQGCR